MKWTVSAVAFAGAAIAQSGAYERCGGKDWSGPTTCVAGFTCQVSNEWYSQCVPVDYSAEGNAGRSGPYGRCGGIGWEGPTACVAGYTCQFVNDWYSQCVLDAARPTDPGTGPAPGPISSTILVTRTVHMPRKTTPAATWTTVVSSSAQASTTMPADGGKGGSGSGKLEWLGVDESAAEFGTGKNPGVVGTDYTFPDKDAISGLIEEGFNIFRIPFTMERMASPLLTSPLQKAYLDKIREIVELITKQGKHAILDAHNAARYNGELVTDTAAFKAFWHKVAWEFRSNANVMFDTNNEYQHMDQDLVLQLNQAAIDGIRSAGATTQYILAEGNSFSGAWTWADVNDNLKALEDPSGKIIYQMHQYLDGDGSGTGPECVSETIGAERLASATRWLRANKKVGMLGEFAGGANPRCKAAVTGMLDHLQANADVWKGALWWGGGPWWGDYMFSFEAPNGAGYRHYDGLLRKYLPE
ncbi:hypothetical protein E4U41_004304 [Claviceps citrina]|nr:hypothetical protein E4U41_004304 [Claviceps citrina]